MNDEAKKATNKEASANLGVMGFLCLFAGSLLAAVTCFGLMGFAIALCAWGVFLTLGSLAIYSDDDSKDAADTSKALSELQSSPSSIEKSKQ